MLVVDSQVHIWAAPTAARPWAGPTSGAPRDEPLGKDELLEQMAVAGVDRAVIVPPSFEGDYNDLALEAAAAHPNQLAIMGRVLIDQPDVAETVSTWRDQPGMLGIRATFHRAGQENWLTDGTAERFFAAAESAQVPVMVFAPHQLSALADVADRFPDLRLCVDHLGLSLDVRDDAVGPALELMLSLASYPNVSVKASAVPAHSTEEYPYPSLHAPIRRVVDTFGPQRVFWGTDFTRLACTYRQAVTLFSEELDLDESEKRLVMGEAVARWLDWELPVDR